MRWLPPVTIYGDDEFVKGWVERFIPGANQTDAAMDVFLRGVEALEEDQTRANKSDN